MSRREFCQLLDEAIKDEAKAKKFYGKLMKTIGRSMIRGEISGDVEEILKSTVSSVTQVEESHHKLFKNLKLILCRR